MDEALSEVSASVATEPGGPWEIFSVYGIAAQASFSPNLIGYPTGENRTVNDCGHLFDGVTLWNGTLPTFHGSFNSGTAPFWQLAYFSNTSKGVLVATDVRGDTHVYSPISMANPCAPWYDFMSNNTAEWTSLQQNPPVDSSVAALNAWATNIAGVETVGSKVGQDSPYVEIMTTGPGVFMGFGDQRGSGWGVYFDRCGEAGVTGVQPLVLSGLSTTGAGGVAVAVTHNCALEYSGAGVYDSMYDLLFSSPSETSNLSTRAITVPFQVGIAYPNGTFAGDYDEVGLANWMTMLTLKDPGGQILAPGTPACNTWAANLSQCPASSTGWYAVLLSPYGTWVDAYRSQFQ